MYSTYSLGVGATLPVCRLLIGLLITGTVKLQVYIRNVKARGEPCKRNNCKVRQKNAQTDWDCTFHLDPRVRALCRKWSTQAARLQLTRCENGFLLTDKSWGLICFEQGQILVPLYKTESLFLLHTVHAKRNGNQFWSQMHPGVQIQMWGSVQQRASTLPFRFCSFPAN